MELQPVPEELAPERVLRLDFQDSDSRLQASTQSILQRRIPKRKIQQAGRRTPQEEPQELAPSEAAREPATRQGRWV
jgi:hypothetical protein